MRRLVTDTMIVTERNLVRLTRAPDLVLAFTVQPVMFLLLFVYVFGGAIVTPGYEYKDFLLPGIIVQNIAFGGFVTALGLNEDVKKGLIDRFRSLPMARPAVLAGRTLADVFTNALSVAVLLGTGLIIGFSFQASFIEIIGGLGLLSGALKWFAEVNPFSIVVNAMRALWIGGPAGNNVWGAVVWSLVILVIFAPLAVRRYRRAAGS